MDVLFVTEEASRQYLLYLSGRCNYTTNLSLLKRLSRITLSDEASILVHFPRPRWTFPGHYHMMPFIVICCYVRGSFLTVHPNVKPIIVMNDKSILLNFL